ncbi:MAG: sodium/solute symporter [bacterium]|nr:sodium/solute symporter [bacterium]
MYVSRIPKAGLLCLALFVLLALAPTAHAAMEDVPQELQGGLSTLDWIVVALYALGMLSVGIYYARKTETADDYYLGGRQMRPSMVGLSLFATLISTISYLAVPGEVINNGPTASLTYLATLPFVFLIVGYLLIPYIMKLKITSAYELLETRLGMPARLVGSTIFLVLRLLWMGLVLHTATKAIVTAIGVPQEHLAVVTPCVMLGLGLLTVVYSSLGGLRAVVLTDVIQCLILFGGAVLCVLIITVKSGGFSWFPTEWASTWDEPIAYSFDLTERITVLGSFLAALVYWICTAGSDQMAIQRYLSTRDAKTARRAFLVNNIADVCVSSTLICLGFALYHFFTTNYPDLLSAEGADKQIDYLFPLFVVNFMKFGLAGLVLSGMLAAAMSSLSSGVNSGSTVINIDIVDYFIGDRLDEKGKVKLGRIASFGIGAVILLLALFMDKIPGNLFAVTNKTANLLVSPLFSLFFLAMFVRWATPAGALTGAFYGTVVAVMVAFSGLTGADEISFQWISTASLITSIGMGCLASLVTSTRKDWKHVILVTGLLTLPAQAALAWFIWACVTKAFA